MKKYLTLIAAAMIAGAARAIDVSGGFSRSVLILALALSLVFAGCEKKAEQPPIDRREDPAYRAEMARLANEQRDSAKRLEAVRRQIASLKAEEARLVGEIEAKRREARQQALERRKKEEGKMKKCETGDKAQTSEEAQNKRLAVPNQPMARD